jgi:peroxiredoxin Q/BCP
MNSDTALLAALHAPVANMSFATTENANMSFADLQGKTVVLYFYPKDNTPGCTLEAKDFRDIYPACVAADICIFGVSRDNLVSHHDFITQCGLPFPLISDADQALCTYFQVIKEKNMYGKKVMGIERSTFLIDSTGVLRQEWRHVKVEGHAAAVFEAAKKITVPAVG